MNKNIDFTPIGLRIRERRRAMKLTQEEVANQLDINPSHLSNIERSEEKPSLILLINLANILQCSVDFFISSAYTFDRDKKEEATLDDKIMDKLHFCDSDKKERILKIIDLL